jgi:hypothetical protein
MAKTRDIKKAKKSAQIWQICASRPKVDSTCSKEMESVFSLLAQLSKSETSS